MSTSSALSSIHDLRTRLQETLDEIAKGPRQTAQRQQSLDKKKAELDTERTKLKQAKVAADQKSLQLKTAEARIYDLEGKLNAAATNREFDAIRTQIAADKMATSVLEDEIYEALVAVDAAQEQIKVREQQLATEEAELTTFRAEVAAKEPGLREAAASLEKQVADMESILPEEIAPQYRRLVQSYGPGALAPVTGKSCGECYIGLTAQVMVDLRSGQFKFCTCGRLLYLAEDK